MGTVDPTKASTRKSLGSAPQPCLEIDLKSGRITWLNARMTRIADKSQVQLQDSSIYSHIHDDFKSRMSEALHRILQGGHIRKTMWPVHHSSQITWWSATLEHLVEGSIFIKCEHLHTTAPKSPEYKLACLIAECRQSVSEAEANIEEMTSAIRGDVRSMNKDLNELEHDLEMAAGAAKLSAEASRANHESTEMLRKEINARFDIFTQDISRLVSSDVLHDQRLKIFEAAVEKRTREAMKTIASHSPERAGIGSKLALPIGTAATATAIIQWLLEHFSRNPGP